MKERIKWNEMTSEEIKLKQLEISNIYEVKKQQSLNLLGELDNLEKEYDNSLIELERRGL